MKKFHKIILGLVNMSLTQIRNFFIEYIRAEFPDVFSKMDFINTPELYKYGIIHGDMLSGKTDAILTLSLYLILSGTVPIISVPKSGDVHQMKKSVKEYNRKWLKYLHEKLGETKPDFACELRFLDAFDLEVDEDNNVVNIFHFQQTFRTMATPFPKVIFTLHHTVQLGRLFQVIQNLLRARCAGPIRPYTMFFDECHRTLEPETLGVYDGPIPKYGTAHFPHMNIGDAVLRLIKGSKQIIGISATPFKSIFSELYPITYVIKCRPRNGDVFMGEYRGVPHLEYNHIEELKDDAEPYEDPELIKVLEELSKTPPLTSNVNIRLPARQLPYITLFQLSHKKDDHEKVYDLMTKKYPDSFSIVIFNSGSIRIKFSKEASKTFGTSIKYFNGTKTCITDVSAEGVVYLDLNTPIHNLLDIFVSLGVEKFERINIIAGNKLREGIRVNSSDYSLAISAEYIRDNSNMDNALQKLRIVGYRRYTCKLRVWCTKRFHSDAIKAFYLTHEIVDKLNQKYHYGEVETALSILKNTTISKAKLPKNKLSKEKIPMKKVKTNYDGFGISALEYAKIIKNTCMRELLSKSEERKIYKHNTIERVDEFIRLTTKMFPKWGRDDCNSKIARFMRHLDPLKTYTEVEIKELCREHEVVFGELLILKRNNSSGYGRIIEKVGEKYRLYADLIEPFNKYF